MESSRDRLIAAAEQVFARRGMHAATVAEIAEAAGRPHRLVRSGARVNRRRLAGLFLFGVLRTAPAALRPCTDPA